jgi:Protein of unknown function (DUF1236)
MRTLVLTLGLTMLLAGPAMAQNAGSQGQSPTAEPGQSAQPNANLQQEVRENLAKAGFTDIQVMPESFLVRAKDQTGNPIMMVINPDSFTAVTQLSNDQSATGFINHANRVNLTSTQRQKIRKSLSATSNETAPSGFTARVGEAVPSSLTLKPLPTGVSDQIPAISSDQYALVQGKVLVVDPTSKQILAIVAE